MDSMASGFGRDSMMYEDEDEMPFDRKSIQFLLSDDKKSENAMNLIASHFTRK